MGALKPLNRPTPLPVKDGEARRDFYSLADVARMTTLSERTIRRMVADGRLAGRRVGGRLLVSANSYRQWVERGR